ncbi:MAG: integral rane protein-like protein [Bryobacterales bacterium]|nr:integral rane protein-like protein [Bryobacterales bacterium]
MILYAATIFLSAFLLFQVQPLIAKIILPWFGGSAAVWAAALLFFQISLLAGYAYAHALTKFAKARTQMMIHGGLLLASCALLPILPNVSWKPTAIGDPTLRILELLAATIGLPYFLLSSTSPLLQAWYVRRTGSSVPYRLFALSNFGSMLALLSFPFVVEPNIASRQQAYIWSTAYVAFAALCLFAAWVSRNKAEGVNIPEIAAVSAAEDSKAARPTGLQLLLWISLAACASTLLVSITNHMSQNVAPIPLLWVVPLAIYLLTFILAFESDKIYQRWIFLPWVAPALGWMAYAIYAGEGNFHIKYSIPIFCAGLFICCMLCHGELALRKPAPQYLTLFYLMVSLGGAIGGIFVAIIAPRMFNSYLELPIGLVACGVLAVIVLFNMEIPRLGPWPVRFALAIGVGLLAGYLLRKELADRQGYHLFARNFYGELRIRDDDVTQEYAIRNLLHGTINHGSQRLNEEHRYDVNSYYAPSSGIGRTMTAKQGLGPVRYGVIGMGAGVMTGYCRAGDYVRVYEINPLVKSLSDRGEFTFFSHCAGDKQVFMGDARLTMEAQPPPNYDVLVVDAFSSDAIPVHLLTREVMQTYFKLLKPDGVLAVHISNRYLDLAPVCARGAEFVHKKATVVADDASENTFANSTTWVLITSEDNKVFQNPSFEGANMYPATAAATFRGWTDDYSSILPILSLN